MHVRNDDDNLARIFELKYINLPISPYIRLASPMWKIKLDAIEGSRSM